MTLVRNAPPIANPIAATIAAGLLAAGLLAGPAFAAPPTAFRVSPRVMQRLRGTPRPLPKVPVEAEPRPVSTGEAAPAEPVNPAPLIAEEHRIAEDEEPAPVKSSSLDRPRTSLTTPPSPKPATADGTTGWTPGDAVTERPWRWIVVHHTATDGGSVKSIHRSHRKRLDGDGNPWRGIGYHFLIGNGEGMADGAVEPTFRWRDQLSGAHAGRRAENDRGVGVCLVGDFDAADPTPSQLSAARRLVAFLQARYDIPADRVLPHDAVSATKCPGERLTVDMLLAPPKAVVAPPKAVVAPPFAVDSAPVSPPSAAALLPVETGDPEDDYLPTGLSAPTASPPSRGPSLAAPAAPAAPRLTSSPPRFGSQDAP